MSDDEIEEFMDLFRTYRARGVLPEKDRERFKQLAEKYRQMQSEQPRQDGA